MFENLRSGRQARNFATNVPKILVLKSSSEQIFSRKLPLGAPEQSQRQASIDSLYLSLTEETSFSLILLTRLTFHNATTGSP